MKKTLFAGLCIAIGVLIGSIGCGTQSTKASVETEKFSGALETWEDSKTNVTYLVFYSSVGSPIGVTPRIGADGRPLR